MALNPKNGELMLVREIFNVIGQEDGEILIKMNRSISHSHHSQFSDRNFQFLHPPMSPHEAEVEGSTPSRPTPIH